MSLSDKKQSKIVDEAIDAFKKGDDDEKRSILQAAQRAGQKWLTDEDFSENYELGKKVASDRGDDEIMMQFWLFGWPKDVKKKKDGGVCMPVMMADWEPEDQNQKKMIMMGLGVKFAEEFPDYMLTSIVHVSEAWTAKEKFDKDGELVMPSANPDRTEIVFVHAQSMDFRQSYCQQEIMRDKDGKFTGLRMMVENIYDPEKPKLADEGFTNRLSRYIFEGAQLAAKKEKNNGATR